MGIKEAAAAFGVECNVVNVRQAKDQLSSLLDRAARGEQIIITSDGRPKAMIVRYRPIIQGAKWTSQRALRMKTLISEDSTPILRAMRTVDIEAMYIDTSVAVKLYVRVPDSDECEAVVAGMTLVSSMLLHGELQSALLSKVTRGKISEKVNTEVWKKFGSSRSMTSCYGMRQT
jgi:prevent-host-death family protein